MKKTNKTLSILLTLVMLVGLLLPAGGAFAATDNYVGSVKSVDSNFKGFLTTIEITEDSDRINTFVYKENFMVTLPSNVEFTDDAGKVVNSGSAVDKGLVMYQYKNDQGKWIDDENGVKATLSNSRSINVAFHTPKATADERQERIVLTFNVQVDGHDGDITALIEGQDSGVTSGEYIIGRVGSGDTTNTVLSVEDIGESGSQKAGIIRIAENAAGTWVGGESYIELSLNGDFYWDTTDTQVSLLGGMADYSVGAPGSGADVIKNFNSDKDELTITFTNSVSKTSTRGIVEITPYINVDSDASYGDVEVDIDGEDVSSDTLVIAKYADYGVQLKLDGDLKEVIAGQMDQKMTTLLIEETIPGSLLGNRKVTIELPEGVKFMNSKTSGDPEYNGAASVSVKKGSLTIKNPNVKKDKVEFNIDGTTTSSTSRIEVQFKKVNVAADAKGDVTVKITGSAGIKDVEFVVGTVVQAITAEAQTKEIKLGVQGQVAGDITIKEAIKGGILEDEDLILELPEGLKFAKAPKVEVTEGNLDIKKDSIKRASDDRQVVIPIDNESTTPSTILVSGIEITADRSVPAGDIYVKIKGKAVAESYEGYTSDNKDDRFTASTAATVYPATVINAAPVAGSVQFNIGSTLYNENGVAKVMDAAPYIKDSRAYVPVRYLALSLGVSENNIAYENGVVTLTKGSTVVKLTVGSNTITVNDESKTMDVAPEVSDGRTMLPARFVAEAFGAQVGYANGTVVISVN
ncbi:stalk domain-containing protein [Desulforamulus ruminis]|uniref:stalk domain-containing protein n=1 Tax=Desulforamulus ruminis TaxID=1564 RepID=UPI002FD9DA92